MIPDDGLRVSVSVEGVFVLFDASDGTTAMIDIPSLAEQLGQGLGHTMLQWCRDRVNETPANELPAEIRGELLSNIDDRLRDTPSIDPASKQLGNPEPISEHWLDQEEARARDAVAVCLSGDQFLELLAVARNGLRPKAMPL